MREAFPITSERIPFFLTFGAIVASLTSPAAANILIGAALAAMIVTRTPLKFPPVVWPVGLFVLGTLISLAFSVAPAAGWPQIRKFYLFLVLLLVTSTFRTVAEARILVLACAGVEALSSVWSMVQFANKYTMAQQLGQPFYQYYTGSRITGFMSHWMTLGGQQMNVLLLMGASYFFARDRYRNWLLPAAGIIVVSMLAGYTRSIWLGTAAGALYLIWFWRKWFVLLTPIPVAILLIANPADIRTRVLSSVSPSKNTDSNYFRVICRRTGWEIIKAHPLLGLGPEQVKVQFLKWIPADIERPLPPGYYQHLHNVYYQYAAERGVPTMLAFLAFIAKFLWDFLRALQRLKPSDDPGPRFLLHGAIAVTIGVLFTAFYEVNVGDGEVLTLFLATVAIGYLAVPDPASKPDPAVQT